MNYFHKKMKSINLAYRQARRKGRAHAPYRGVNSQSFNRIASQILISPFRGTAVLTAGNAPP